MLTVAKLQECYRILDTAGDPVCCVMPSWWPQPTNTRREELMGFTFYTPIRRETESKVELIARLERERKSEMERPNGR